MAFKIVSFREEQRKATILQLISLAIQNHELAHDAIFCKPQIRGEVAGTFRDETGTPPGIIAPGEANLPTIRR